MPSISVEAERSSRMVDYLNDKLQSTADLDSVPELLHSIQEKQVILRQQHAEAAKVLQDARRSSKIHTDSLVRRVGAFEKQQTDIDRRLMALAQSETSDEAVVKFDEVMSKLRRLEVAQGYVGLLCEVASLHAEARRNFKASPQAALKPYLRLKNLASGLKAAQPAAEDAAPHLTDYVDQSANGLWEQMKGAFAQELEDVLKKVKWPRKDIDLNGMPGQEWAAGVERLLELQEPELVAHEAKTPVPFEDRDQLVLLPLEIMVKPLQLRFQYHFEGEKATNRLDKPEFFFSHVLDLISTYDSFFLRYLEPILRRQYRASELALNPLYTDSTEAWITALLPMLRRKIRSILPAVSSQPHVFSHLIRETMNFDSVLTEDWNYSGGSEAERWKGLTWQFLAKEKWFEKWLRVEQEFAMSRYQAIIFSSENREIDYDSVDPGVTKPTKAAIQVNDLLETITDRYQPLPSFQHKLQFLIDVQIAVFDKFHEALRSSLEAYLSVTSSIARTVQGISREEQEKLQGVAGLDRLCRVYGSADYLEKKMRDWNDNVFFIELWDELQSRACKRGGHEGLVTETMTLEDVADRTSQAVGTQEHSGALFDETAGAYRRLRVRAEEILQEKLAYDLQEALRPYGRLNSWAYVASDSPSPVTSPELGQPLEQISSYMGFLAKVLAKVSLRRIMRQLCLSLQTFLWDHTLMRNNFSTAGVAQLKCDISTLWTTIDNCSGYGQGRMGMRKLGQALELLSLPVKSEVEGAEDLEELEPYFLDARHVEERLFKDNESARGILDELNIDTLTESEARSILEKRLELAN